ncbi:DUF6868 family protein [Crateriforma conspicua]|uniref:DUF6868 domain-containing protein n=1 Tax=Crateriforma conspicua TaxID=2527996 RepID=A0A5C6FTU1_9PLAN|nr:hypothetical protein [Crateriforma conspicua]TWU64975.1 hypothetical protein V7x_05190 [Crateriforma conspicua]
MTTGRSITDLQTLRRFLGVCTLLNFGMLTLATGVLLAAGGPIASLHSRWFGLPEATLSVMYFSFLAGYKLLILGFNLVPYLALRCVDR